MSNYQVITDITPVTVVSSGSPTVTPVLETVKVSVSADAPQVVVQESNPILQIVGSPVQVMAGQNQVNVVSVGLQGPPGIQGPPGPPGPGFSGLVLSGNIGSGQVAAAHISSGTILAGTNVSVTQTANSITIASTVPPLGSGSVQSGMLGNGAVQSGNLSPAFLANLSVPPSGPAGGVLTGSYPNPGIGTGVVASGNLASGLLADLTVPPNGPAGGSLTGTYPNPGIGTGVVASGNLAPSFLANLQTPPTGTAGGSLTGTYPNPGIGTGVVASGNLASGLLADLSVPPNGPAGGVLTGTYPNPGLGNGVVASGNLAPSFLANLSVPPNGSAGGSLTGTYPNPGIANSAVLSGQLGSGQVAAAHISSGTILAGTNVSVTQTLNSITIASTVPPLSSGSVQSGMLGDGAVQSGNLSPAFLANLQTPPTGAAGGSLTGTYPNPGIANSAVLSGQIGSGQVAAPHISSGTIIAGSNVTVTQGLNNITVAATIPPLSGLILSGQIGSGQVAAAHISSGTIIAGSNVTVTQALGNITIASTIPPLSGLILSGQIGSGQVAAAHISSGTIIAGSNVTVTQGLNNITVAATIPPLSGLILSGQIGSGQVAAAHISSGTIIAGSNVTITQALGNITVAAASQLTSGSVQSGMLGNGAVNFVNLASGLLSGLVLSGQIGSGQVGAAHISSGTLLPGAGIVITPGLSGITITNLSGGSPSSLGMGTTIVGSGLSSGSSVGLSLQNPAITSSGTFGVEAQNSPVLEFQGHQWNWSYGLDMKSVWQVGVRASPATASGFPNADIYPPALAITQNTVTSGAVTSPWTYVQSASAATGVGSLSQSFSSNVTAGNLLQVYVSCFTSGTVSLGVSDTQSNSYTLAANYMGNSNRLLCYYAKAKSTGSNTVSVTGAAPYSAMAIMEHHPPATGTIAVDGVSAGNFGSTTSVSTGNIPVTGSSRLVVGWYGQGAVTTSPSAGTGFTLRAHADDGVDFEAIATESAENVSSSVNATFTIGTSVGWAALGISYQVVGYSANSNNDTLVVDRAGNLFLGTSGTFANVYGYAQFLADNVVVSGKIASGTIGVNQLVSGLVSGKVLSGQIGSGQVGFVHLASGLLSGLVLSGQIGSGQVGAPHISSGTILPGAGITVTPGLSGITITNLSGGSPNSLAFPTTLVASGLASGATTGLLLQNPAFTRSGSVQVESQNSPMLAWEGHQWSYGDGLDLKSVWQAGVRANPATSGLGNAQYDQNYPAWVLNQTTNLSGFAGTNQDILVIDRKANVYVGTSGSFGNVYGYAQQVGPGVMEGYINNGNLTWLNGNQISVNKGACRDYGDVQSFSIASGIVDITTSGAWGVSQHSANGTIQVLSGTHNVSGTGTNFLSTFGTAIQGAGLVTASGTNCVGYSGSTQFVGFVNVDDLIGNPTDGYVRVSIVNSGTIALTVSGKITSGNPWYVIQQPTLSCTGLSGQVRPWSILSDTVMLSNQTATVTASGATLTVGPMTAAGMFGYVWAGTGLSGNACWVETKETIPYGVPGYNSYMRRIGSIPIGTSGVVITPFTQTGNGSTREYAVIPGALNRAVNGATLEAWTDQSFYGSNGAPATANVLILAVGTTTSGASVYVQTRGATQVFTASGELQSQFLTYNAIAQCAIACDGAQYISWRNNISGATYIGAAGFREDL